MQIIPNPSIRILHSKFALSANHRGKVRYNRANIKELREKVQDLLILGMETSTSLCEI